MVIINRMFFVLGLLASAGSLVHGRHTIGRYGGSDDVYRGEDYDYTTSYGASDVYSGSHVYRGRDYNDYTTNVGGSDVYRARDSDYTTHAYASTERVSGYPDWDVQERSSYLTQPDAFPQENHGFMNQESNGWVSDDLDDKHQGHHGHQGHDGSPSPAPAPSDEAPPSPSDTVPPSTDKLPKGNPIDDCWRQDPNWPYNRQALAKCAVGFGKNALGGANGPIYVVTDESDEDLVNPKEGTLRYAVLQDGPLWIGFSKDMTIKLQNELIMSSFKTIDGRGFNIHISGGAGITVQYISNVIVHGIHMHDLTPTGQAIVRSNSSHAGHRLGSDGDAINIFGSHDVWVDHCYFARGSDGLVDAIMGSTNVSVTNNFFEQHDKVMLFGAHPFDTMDGGMQISVAFNYFAPGLIERVPRVRHGHVHVFNNYYASWGEYAIGGSEAPTILSQGNVFNAPNTRDKQVTKRIDDGDASYKDCKDWNWQSVGDQFLNGAFFVSGGASAASAIYSAAVSTSNVVPATIVPDITRDAGPLACPPTGGLC